MRLWECVSFCDRNARDRHQHALSSCAEFGRHPHTSVGRPVGEGSSDPSHRTPRRYSHTTSVVSHHVKFISKFASVKLKSTLIQKAKCFDQIPCLVIPASALVKMGESEMEMQSISVNSGRKLALKTETKPRPQFYLFT